MRFCKSIFRIRSPGQREDNTPFRRTAPPASPVPEPRGTIGTLARLAALNGGHPLYVAWYDHYFRHHLKDRAVLLVNDDIFLFEQNISLADDGG